MRRRSLLQETTELLCGDSYVALDPPEREGVDRVVPRNRQDARAVRHDHELALTDDGEPGLLQSAHGIEVIDARNTRHGQTATSILRISSPRSWSSTTSTSAPPAGCSESPSCISPSSTAHPRRAGIARHQGRALLAGDDVRRLGDVGGITFREAAPTGSLRMACTVVRRTRQDCRVRHVTAASSAGAWSPSSRVGRDQFAHLGHERSGDLHEGLALILESSLVFGDGLVLRLCLVVRQNLSDAILVPAWWKAALCHVCPL